MKGVELIASLIGFLVFFGISVLLGGTIIIALNVQASVGHPKTYEMTLSPIYPPIKYESMLLSYLESTDDNSGFQVKKLLVYAAYQRNMTNIFIDGEEVTTLKSTSSKIFSEWIKDHGYLLVFNIDGEPHVLAGNRAAFGILPNRMLKIRRISIPTYIDYDSFIGKDREIPLNVTLDLYVR